MSLYATGVGRIISDIETRQVSDTSTVYKFAIGLNEGKDKNGEYIRNAIDVEIWNKAGEVVANYAGKGASVQLTGTIHKQEWIDKESGAKRSKHIFKAGRAELLPRDTQGEQQSAPATAVDAEVLDEDDIPF